MESSSWANVYSRTRLRVLLVLIALGAAQFFLSVARAKAPLNLDVLARDGYGVVSINRPEPNELTVSGKINGHVVYLALDSGWGHDGITVDSSLALDLNLSLQATKEGSVSVSGARTGFLQGMAGLVGLGNVQLKGVPLFVGTFGAFRSEHPLLANGFVGAKFLHTNSAIIDLQNLRLYLRPPRTGRRVQIGPALKAVGLSEVPMTWDGQGHYLVEVEINGVTGKMVIDTGAFITVIDPRFAPQMKDSGYGTELVAIDAAGVSSRLKRTRARSFKINGVAVPPPDVVFTPGSFYTYTGGKVIGLLGMDVLGQNWSIIDFGQQKLYFASAR